MVDDIERNYKNESLERLRTQVMAGLEMDEDEPAVGFQLESITTADIDEYLNLIDIDQSVHQKLFKVSSYNVRDPYLFGLIQDYCCFDKIFEEIPPNQRIYFIQSGDSAITLIPIEIPIDNKNETPKVEVNISLLDNSPKEIEKIYKNLGKLKMEDIKFVKFNKK